MPTLNLRRLFAAPLLALALATPAMAEGLRVTARYAITLGGTHIAQANVTLDDTGSAYTMALDAKISGLAQLVASGSAKLASSGISTGSGLKSRKFDLLTRANGEDFTVAITYADAGVASFIVEPPIVNNIDRIAIERKQLGAVNDMAAAFVLRGKALDPGLCDRKLQIFNGIERFNLSLAFAKDDVATSKRTGYQGPVVACRVRYTPISGHYTTSDVTTYLAQNDRILIWYAPLATPGYFIPYRALVTTEAGDISIVLTELTQ